jgi:RES domain
MPTFESWKQYAEFSWFVKRKSRHILDAKNQRFLDAVVETSAKRKGFIQKGAALWRAQLGHAWSTEIMRDENGQEVDSFEVEGPFPPERMIPLPDRANEGRVNPKGIPCLYFSTDMDTAMTETRPWIGSHVSVAQFVILKDLSVVDCSADSAKAGLIIERKAGAVEGEWEWGVKDPNPDEWENIVWGDINRAFSQPVARTDDVAEYAPTQILAEAFRSAGLDGVVYGSRLGVGKTVAIFDLAAAELANCHLYQLEAINPKFSMAANPYYVTKYCKSQESGASDNPGKEQG